MKTRLLPLVLLAFGCLPLAAQTVKPAPPSPVAPAKAKPEAKKADEKKEAPKIEGIVIERPGGGLLGLKLEGGTFKLSFYDKDRKPVPVDFPRAAARWNPNYKQGSERMILNPAGDGKSLVGGRPVRPPHTFKLYLTLLTAAGDEGAATERAGESYVVDFRN